LPRSCHTCRAGGGVDRVPRGVADRGWDVKLHRVALPGGWEARERLEDGEIAKRHVVNAIATLLHSDKPAAAELIGKRACALRERPETLRGHAHTTERVRGGRVLPRGHEQELRLEALQHRLDHASEREPVAVIARARRK